MKKKNNNIFIFGVLVVITLLVLGLTLYFSTKKDKENVSTDAIKFKKEYEKYNNKEAGNGYKYPKVTLDDNNKFVYSNTNEIIETLKNGTGIIYFGFPQCPWCRNSVNVLNYLNVDKILYLDVLNLRDSYEVKNGSLEKTKEPGKGYYEILSLLDEVLDDYELVDNGVAYKTGEKRLYVPLVVGVKEGKIVGYHVDTVTLDNDQTPYDLLTKKQQEELKEIYDGIVNEVYKNTCSIDNNNGC